MSDGQAFPNDGNLSLLALNLPIFHQIETQGITTALDLVFTPPEYNTFEHYPFSDEDVALEALASCESTTTSRITRVTAVSTPTSSTVLEGELGQVHLVPSRSSVIADFQFRNATEEVMKAMRVKVLLVEGIVKELLGSHPRHGTRDFHSDVPR